MYYHYNNIPQNPVNQNDIARFGFRFGVAPPHLRGVRPTSLENARAIARQQTVDRLRARVEAIEAAERNLRVQQASSNHVESSNASLGFGRKARKSKTRTTRKASTRGRK